MKQKKNKKNNSNSEKERRDGQLTHFTLLFSLLFSLGRFCCCLLCCCYSSCCCLSCYWACCKLSWAWALALFVSRRRSKVERIFGYRIRQSAMLQVSAKLSMQKRQHSNEKEKEKEKERGRRDRESVIRGMRVQRMQPRSQFYRILTKSTNWSNKRIWNDK